MSETGINMSETGTKRKREDSDGSGGEGGCGTGGRTSKGKGIGRVPYTLDEVAKRGYVDTEGIEDKKLLLLEKPMNTGGQDEAQNENLAEMVMKLYEEDNKRYVIRLDNLLNGFPTYSITRAKSGTSFLLTVHHPLTHGCWLTRKDDETGQLRIVGIDFLKLTSGRTDEFLKATGQDVKRQRRASVGSAGGSSVGTRSSTPTVPMGQPLLSPPPLGLVNMSQINPAFSQGNYVQQQPNVAAAAPAAPAEAGRLLVSADATMDDGTMGMPPMEETVVNQGRLTQQAESGTGQGFFNRGGDAVQHCQSPSTAPDIQRQHQSLTLFGSSAPAPAPMAIISPQVPILPTPAPVPTYLSSEERFVWHDAEVRCHQEKARLLPKGSKEQLKYLYLAAHHREEMDPTSVPAVMPTLAPVPTNLSSEERFVWHEAEVECLTKKAKLLKEGSKEQLSHLYLAAHRREEMNATIAHAGATSVPAAGSTGDNGNIGGGSPRSIAEEIGGGNATNTEV